jgi:hypothetical protein
MLLILSPELVTTNFCARYLSVLKLVIRPLFSDPGFNDWVEKQKTAVKEEVRTPKTNTPNL